MIHARIPSLAVGLLVATGAGLPALAQDTGAGSEPRQPAKTMRLGAGPAVPIEVIFTNLPGDPTAQVPGFPGIEFGPGTGTTHFDRPFGSPNGNWTLVADTTLPTTSDEVVLVNGVIGAREGIAAPWTGGAEIMGVFDTRVPINDAGTWLFATNTDGATGADEYIVQVAGGDFTVVAQEGQPVPPIPGATWGSSLDTAVIAADGTVGFSSDLLLGLPTTMDDVLLLGSGIIAQEGATVPSGQVGTEFWENFDIDDFWLSADGSHWLAQGDLAGDTNFDGIVTVDGAVVVQEGVILPGSGFAEPVDLAGIVGVHMAPDGTWFVRGNNDLSEQDWVYSNGAVIATLGDPIYAGAAETWTDVEFADCFFLHIGDGRGNFVVGGVSDGPTTSNGLLVANASFEVAREADPFDLDGNGTFDDDTYFNTFGNDDGYLSDDGWFYFTATIQDGLDVTLGQGFFRADLSCLLMPFADGFESADTSSWCLVVN